MSEAAAAADQTVLVVEDDPDVAAMLQTYLELHGYAVILAAGAADAMSRLEARPARVAVVDAHLPDRSGLDLTRELRSMPWSPSILIYTAGMASPVEAEAAGADGFLLKTAPLSELLVQIESLGARRPLGIEPASAP